MGYRYKLHDRDLPGRPDMVFPARRKIIEVRGCWWHWHGCANSVMPQTRADWWTAKLEGNVARDARNVAALESAGWAILIVWECEVRTDAKAAALKAVDFLGPTGIVVPTAKLGTLRVEKVESGNREHGHQR